MDESKPAADPYSTDNVVLYDELNMIKPIDGYINKQKLKLNSSQQVGNSIDFD